MAERFVKPVLSKSSERYIIIKCEKVTTILVIIRNLIQRILPFLSWLHVPCCDLVPHQVTQITCLFSVAIHYSCV